MIVTCSRCGAWDSVHPTLEDYSDFSFCYQIHGYDSVIEYIVNEDLGWLMRDGVVLCDDCLKDLEEMGFDDPANWCLEYEDELLTEV